MLGRAAYANGVPLWVGTLRDELHEQYQQHTRSPANLPDTPRSI
jgi:hypothetical protein